MDDLNNRLKRLNKKQLEAVNIIDGPLAIQAGPGTGKTQLLTMRIENILKQVDILPSNILCLTFTDSAAENMRQRLFHSIGKSARKVEFYTFHSFGTHVINRLQEFSDSVLPEQPIEEIKIFEIIERLLDELNYKNPLSRKIDGSYFYIGYIKDIFQWLKRSGMSPDTILKDLSTSEQFYVSTATILNNYIPSRTSPKNIPMYNKLFLKLKTIHQQYPSLSGKNSLIELSRALDESSINKSTKPLSAWKSKWFRKDSKNNYVYKDQLSLPKFIATVNLFNQYQDYLKTHSLYDFDDMILKAIYALSTNDELRYNIQEQYQYILVDEYQDTNGAQNSLLDLLCSNPVHENSPNLMVVGDPNQAIFSFQGADSNLLKNFAKKWSNTKEITLIDSYRSGQELLDFSKSVLDSYYESSTSEKLIATTSNQTSVININDHDQDGSYYSVAEEIKKLINQGKSPNEICVISKEHKYLANILPFLIDNGIPISYERDNNLLDNQRIAEIVDLIYLISAIKDGSLDKINAYLIKILSAPYLDIDVDYWWEIILMSRDRNKSLLNLVERCSDKKIVDFVKAIKAVAKISINASYKLIISYLIGAKPIKLGVNDYKLPWLDYYFSDESNLNNVSEYVVFASQFNKLNSAFENWLFNKDQIINIDKFLEFIKLISKNYINLTDPTLIKNSDQAVTLTTTYKAKGNEWNYVFVIDCQNSVWNKIKTNRLNQFALPNAYKFIEPAIFQDDNLVNPFYVAITRAKKSLYLINYTTDKTNKASETLDWINKSSLLEINTLNQNKSPLTSFINNDWETRLLAQKSDLKHALRPILREFSLSATDFNNYLEIEANHRNNFILNSLIKIPRYSSPPAVYGTAVHASLNNLYEQLRQSQKLITSRELLNYFDKKLLNTSLSDQELTFFKRRGYDELSLWYKNNKSKISTKDISELKLTNVYLKDQDIKLNGKIDLLKFKDSDLSILDYKTSSSPKNNRYKSDIKYLRYKRQLIFYKLLLENSSFLIKGKKPKVENGIIEFLTPDEYSKTINYEIVFDNSEVSRTTKLIEIVWKKINNFEFIDTSIYPSNYKGAIQLEDDLLSG